MLGNIFKGGYEMKLSEQNYMVPRLDEIPIRNVPSPDVVTKKGRRDAVFSREPTHPYGPAIDRTSGMPAMIHLAGRVYGSSVEEYVVGSMSSALWTVGLTAVGSEVPEGSKRRASA